MYENLAIIRNKKTLALKKKKTKKMNKKIKT